MTMKKYTTLYWSLELEPHYQMQFSVIPKTHLFLVGILPFLREILSAYFKPRWQSVKRQNVDDTLSGRYWSFLVNPEENNLYFKTDFKNWFSIYLFIHLFKELNKLEKQYAKCVEMNRWSSTVIGHSYLGQAENLSAPFVLTLTFLIHKPDITTWVLFTIYRYSWLCSFFFIHTINLIFRARIQFLNHKYEMLTAIVHSSLNKSINIIVD